MEKKNQNQKFQELVKKMETLKETEKGKLKGGFTAANSFGEASATVAGNNCVCHNEVAHCGS